MKFIKKQETVAYLLVAAIAGGFVGGISGGITARFTISSDQNSTDGISTTSTKVDIPVLVKIEPERIPQRIPPKDVILRDSPVASVYRGIRLGTPEARTLDNSRLLGQAVSLTSDGWFVTTVEVVSGLRPIEITLWHKGTSYTVTRIITDSTNGTAFFKIDAHDLPSSSFSTIDDVLLGSEAWVERRPKEFDLALLHTLNIGIEKAAAQSSDFASRRFGVTAQSMLGDLGAPVWDSSGALLGLVENEDGRTSIIPSNTIATSLASLLTNSTITHADLGVLARDLSSLRIDGDRGTYSASGALVTKLDKGGVAEVAGIKVGDVILQVERDILDGTADLGEVLSEFRPGTEVTIRFARNGIEQTILMFLGTNTTSKEIK